MPRKSRLPVYVSIFHTFTNSCDALARAATGRLNLDTAEHIVRRWSQQVFDAGQAHLAVVGREHLVDGQAYVVMANHTSLLDIPAIFLAFPGPVRAVAKSELSKVPIWGPAMGAMGMIFVDRGDRARAIAQLEKAKETLTRGVSVFVAPEGTRSRDGALHAFKKGGFHLALDLGAPIVPTWVDGASQVIVPDTFMAAYGGTVTVKIGRPIDTRGMTKDDLPALMKRVRKDMLALGGPSAKDAAPDDDAAAHAA